MRWTRPRIAALQEQLRAVYPDARCALTHGNPYELVAATILSAQCTDARVNLVTPAFFARFPDAPSLAGGTLAEVEGLIRSTGFYRHKARNLIGMAQDLVERHGGQVPSDPVALGRLPGVGQKTANVVLANAFGVPALAVDTHIFRVARRLGVSTAKTPEKVEADLCGLFPRADWIELHHQLIIHGRRACHAQRPDCAACPLLHCCPVGQGKSPDPHTGLPVSISRHQTPDTRLRTPDSSLHPRAEGPQRIICLVPSVTELLVQWGLASRLVGRTRYCVEPRWIRNTVPAVGGTKDPDLRTIVALKPDLVILETDENLKATADALTVSGISWLTLEIRTVADCAKACRQLGKRLGVPDQGKASADAIRKAGSGAHRKGPRALVLIWRDPWMAAGPDTYLGDLLRRSGFTPVGPRRYPPLGEDELRNLAPEVVLLPTEPYRFNARHKRELQAIFPEARIQLVDGRALTWYLSRTSEGLDLLRELRAET
jgi:endonuclease-3